MAVVSAWSKDKEEGGGIYEYCIRQLLKNCVVMGFVCLCMHGRVCIYKYTSRMYARACVFENIRVCFYVCMYVYFYTYDVCILVQIVDDEKLRRAALCMSVYALTRMYTHACIYMCTYICI